MNAGTTPWRPLSITPSTRGAATESLTWPRRRLNHRLSGDSRPSRHRSSNAFYHSLVGIAGFLAVQSGPGLITGGALLEFTGTGVVHLAADQFGDDNWNRAPTVSRTVILQVPDPIMGIRDADFDGDGLADPAIYDDRGGDWIIKMSGNGYALMAYTGILGGLGWMPAAGDYDGDGLTDPAVYQAASGNWTIMQSGSGYAPAAFPACLAARLDAGGFRDYDGDGRSDPSIYQELSGNWQPGFQPLAMTCGPCTLSSALPAGALPPPTTMATPGRSRGS